MRKQISLHLKILSGYLILGLLVLGIITAVWYEKQVFEQAEAEERSLLMQRAAASEAYRGLITLFLDNDRAMLWDDSDMDTYDRRESHTMEVIDRLKGYYGEPAQTARIDTVVRLLHEKRRLIESGWWICRLRRTAWTACWNATCPDWSRRHRYGQRQ